MITMYFGTNKHFLIPEDTVGEDGEGYGTKSRLWHYRSMPDGHALEDDVQ